ncbi:hypothetical protein [Streptomyces sp. NBC_01304]|uniref:hypothetical protein n=1 Tax=Streptomyces sp. NBC_01304 TaxID=2903818 RepID=UPI002E0F2BDA|nr:hypothetical protein OG430_05365 [Streptomyces sp. NBC_01304]
MHDEFLCEVTGYGVHRGRRIGVPLGTYRAPSLPLALWWLRERATWLAERLDPTPDTTRLPPAALAPVPPGTPDAPTELRAWRSDPVRQEVVAVQLASGLLVRFVAHDETTEYELLAESVDALRMRRVAPALPPGNRRLPLGRTHSPLALPYRPRA